MKYSSQVCKCILHLTMITQGRFPGLKSTPAFLLCATYNDGIIWVGKNLYEHRVRLYWKRGDSGWDEKRCTAQRTVQNRFKLCLGTDAMGISWIWQMDKTKEQKQHWLPNKVAVLQDVLSPAALMGECHAGFTLMEGVFHPSVPPSSSPQSQQELGMDTTSPCTMWVKWAAETHWVVPPGNTRASHCTLRASSWRRPQWYTLLWCFQTTFLHHQKSEHQQVLSSLTK